MQTHHLSQLGESVQVITCQAVICAVPLTQLQKQAIEFRPPLAAAKQGALHRVHMRNAIKVWAVFSRRFWPSDVWDVVCTHRLFPEFWMCSYTPAAEDAALADTPPPDREAIRRGAAADEHCVTAFVCGDRARALATRSADGMVQLLVKQVDEVLGHGAASASFVRGAAIDWSKEPFIEGGYSSPSLGARAGDRALLAAPERGVLFFAGEHTHPGINPCLQGAMETGDRAAAQVALALESRLMSSKL